jgi:hypothetical protein
MQQVPCGQILLETLRSAQHAAQCTCNVRCHVCFVHSSNLDVHVCDVMHPVPLGDVPRGDLTSLWHSNCRMRHPLKYETAGLCTVGLCICVDEYQLHATSTAVRGIFAKCCARACMAPALADVLQLAPGR